MSRSTVLINNFNYGAYVGAAIGSAIEHADAETEIIVVDDGSTDNSRSVIDAFGSRIRMIFQENAGQASCFNAGFAAATGEIVFLLDADDMFLDRKIPRVKEIFAGHPEIGWCFDKAQNDARAQPAEPRIVLTDKRDAMRNGRFPSIPAPTSGLAFRRACLAKILPMPMASDIALSDNYLKFAAAYLAPGALLGPGLTFQRIHEANRYTGRGRNTGKRSQIMIETGFALAKTFPELNRIGMELVSGGMATGPAILRRGSDLRKRASTCFGPGSYSYLVLKSGAKRLKYAVQNIAQMPRAEHV